MPAKIDSAFEALRLQDLDHPEVWRPIYRDGLLAAFEAQEFEAAAELAAFAASALESQGHYDEALAELDFAIPQSKDSPEVAALLLGTKAGLQALRGDAAGRDSLAAAEALESEIESKLGRAQLDALRVVIACVLLDAGSPDAARDSIHRARSDGFEWLGQGIEIWAIPAMIARGDSVRARPWSSALAIQTEAMKALFRRADAAAIEYGLSCTSAMPAIDPEPFARMRRNNLAAWRVHITSLRNALLRRDLDAARETLSVLEGLAPRLNPGHREGLPAFEASVQALAGELDPDWTMLPPERLTLVNLPWVLAAMEVVATGGSQELAVTWARWVTGSVPQGIHTSLEWPASLARVHALLLVRMGRERAGVAMMERALRWTQQTGYIIEAGLCEVQLAELLALGPSVAPERRWGDLRRSGRVTLQALGIDPLPYAYAATEAISWGRITEAEPKLSPREVEVLGLLTEGLTYRQVGASLGIEWRTVQVHARHIYEKLGVSGKMRAAARARELGII